MGNEKPPSGGSDSNQSALERYLAKQKKDRGVSPAATAKPPRPEAKSVFKHTQDPLSIPRPGETEQPATLGRWEKTSFEEPDVFERKALDAGVPVPPREARGSGGVTSSEASPSSDSGVTSQNAGEFGTRLLAAIVDFTIVGAIGYPARMILTALFALVFGPVVNLYLDGISYLTSALVIYAYYGYFYSIKGASPGKMLLNLEVADSATGKKLTPWKAFFREAIGKPISGIPFFMGYIIVLFRDDRKALHDLLFDTQVVNRKA